MGLTTSVSSKSLPELNRALFAFIMTVVIRYHFGTTQVTGSQIEEDKVQSLKPFEDGEPYSIKSVSTTKTCPIRIGSLLFLLNLI